MSNITEKIKDAASSTIKYLFIDFKYEPINKCKKAFIYSMLANVILLITGMVTTFIDIELTKIVLLLLAISGVLSLLSFINIGKIGKMITENKIFEIKGLVIKNNVLSRVITVVTEDQENYEFIIEPEINIKKNIHYKFYYYERNDNLIVMSAIQVSGKEKSK